MVAADSEPDKPINDPNNQSGVKSDEQNDTASFIPWYYLIPCENHYNIDHNEDDGPKERGDGIFEASIMFWWATGHRRRCSCGCQDAVASSS